MCEPWFEVPLVTEWNITTEGRDTMIKATSIEKTRVVIRDIPSITTTSADILSAMNSYDAFVAEQEREAVEDAKRKK